MFAPERAARVWEECRTATRGCVQNKQELAEVVIEMTEPFRAARAKQAMSSETIERLLHEGARKARAVAHETMREVKRAMGLAKEAV
jgi:tryptophanyl-tRNA synthetase